jgi:hypothetical protein
MNHVVIPLKGGSYFDGEGQVRCIADVVVGNNADTKGGLPCRLEISQDGKTFGTSEASVPLDAGDHVGVELSVKPSTDEINGCMPFTLVMTVAGAKKSMSASPYCPD